MHERDDKNKKCTQCAPCLKVFVIPFQKYYFTTTISFWYKNIFHYFQTYKRSCKILKTRYNYYLILYNSSLGTQLCLELPLSCEIQLTRQWIRKTSQEHSTDILNQILRQIDQDVLGLWSNTQTNKQTNKI